MVVKYLHRMTLFNRGNCAFLESAPTSRGGLWRWGSLGGCWLGVDGAGWGLWCALCQILPSVQAKISNGVNSGVKTV